MMYYVSALLACLSLYQYFSKSRLKRHVEEVGQALDKAIREENYKVLLYNSNEIVVQQLLVAINKLMDEKRLERIIREERDLRIKEMLSNVSHDLKTPLTVITGYAEMISGDKSIDEVEKEEMLHSLVDKVKEVNQLITRFFTLAKLESGDEKIQIGRVNLSEIIRDNVIAFHNILEEKGFRVEVELSEEDLWVQGNVEALNRILSNIISNAVRYGSEGKYLGVIVAENSNFVNIDISDMGQGINKADIDKVFERSYTGSKSRSSEDSGSGLGLTITKALVKALGGNIQVQSAPYEKTTFSIRLRK